MKRLIVIITVICIASLSFFLFTGCPALGIYYIKFKVDGESKIWEKGFTDYESNAFGFVSTVDDKTRLFATPDVVASTDDIDNYIQFRINGSSMDTYPNTEVYMWFREGGGIRSFSDRRILNSPSVIVFFVLPSPSSPEKAPSIKSSTAPNSVITTVA